VAVGTGTAVTFLFTCNTDLFFAVAVLSARREVNRGRRVMTFPSGLLGWEFNLKLFVSLGGGLNVRLFVLVRRGEDAKGDGDAGLKVQIGDLSARESSPRQPFVMKGRQEEFSCSFWGLKEEKGGEAADDARFLT
jgi:hypothetical protein